MAQENRAALPHANGQKHDLESDTESRRGHQSNKPSTDPSSPRSFAAKGGKAKASGRKKFQEDDAGKKRRCISSACVPCRKRKSKCDGSTPSCSACAAVYNTECVYDPNSDHRRKGVYKQDIDNLKTRNSTLQTLIQAILNYPEDEAMHLVRQIRTCESLDSVAETILRQDNGLDDDDEEETGMVEEADPVGEPTFESHLSGKMGELQLEDGSTRYLGGTSILLNVGGGSNDDDSSNFPATDELSSTMTTDPITSWTGIDVGSEVVLHLLNMYFTWHYSFFTTLSKSLFYQDFFLGNPGPYAQHHPEYCSPLLVNTMLALGCHFTSHPHGREVKDDSATAGDHFFKEAKKLMMEQDLHEKPRLTTVQALALMSVREAGCGREAKGWVYSGMSFRMACDLGLNLDPDGMYGNQHRPADDAAEDARRITFWGCFLFDKCWSNYLGRLPQLPRSVITVQKPDAFPNEESEKWAAYTDSGWSEAHAQPARTRTIARQISTLCEISADLMLSFYNPIDMDKVKGKQTQLKKLSDIHQRLEAWRRELPKELEPKEGGLPNMLVMHMFFQLLFVHLFRPFLKYTEATSPLPPHVSPRKILTQSASMISKLMRLYKRSHGLRQIPNIVVYILHSACTIHLLNLPDKIARRDIVHGVKNLEEIAEGWLCARRSLGILRVLARKWKVDLPEEAAVVLARAEQKFGPYRDPSTPRQAHPAIPQQQQTSPPQMYNMSPQTNLNIFPTEFATSSTSMPQQTSPSAAFFNSSNLYSSASATAETATASRRFADNRSIPPVNASDFALPRAQRIPNSSNTNTPQTTTTPITGQTSPSAHEGNSPSAFWSGPSVDQLQQESQDWWIRDQTQLARNWNEGGSGWDAPNGAAPWDLAFAGDMGAQWVEGNGAAAAPVDNAGAPGSGKQQTDNAAAAAFANGVFAGLAPGNLSTYNEEDWYQ